jgi:predicted nucleic acid-binding protein
MTFADLSRGERLFLDANPLVYHFGSHSLLGPASRQLLRRIGNQELTAFTSTHVLSEAALRASVWPGARSSVTLARESKPFLSEESAWPKR